MGQLLMQTQQPYLVIDCRFDYEYQAGHINGAINLNTPEQMEAFFLRDKSII